MRLLAFVLKRIVKTGHLALIDARGVRSELGEGGGPALCLRLHDRATERAILLNPQLAFGEAYMDGRLTVEGGDIADVLELLTRNLGRGFGGGHWEWINRLRLLVRRWMQRNNLERARRNVAHHYDLE